MSILNEMKFWIITLSCWYPMVYVYGSDEFDKKGQINLTNEEVDKLISYLEQDGTLEKLDLTDGGGSDNNSDKNIEKKDILNNEDSDAVLKVKNPVKDSIEEEHLLLQNLNPFDRKLVDNIIYNNDKHIQYNMLSGLMLLYSSISNIVINKILVIVSIVIVLSIIITCVFVYFSWRSDSVNSYRFLFLILLLEILILFDTLILIYEDYYNVIKYLEHKKDLLLVLFSAVITYHFSSKISRGHYEKKMLP